MQHVIYIPSQGVIVDTAIVLDDGRTVIGLHSGETLRQIRRRHPEVQLGRVSDVTEDQEKAFRIAPTPCTSDAFYDALENMPPLDWHHDDRGESFKASEFTTARITNIYARVGHTYWMMADVSTLTHDDVIRRIEAQLWAAATVL